MSQSPPSRRAFLSGAVVTAAAMPVLADAQTARRADASALDDAPTDPGMVAARPDGVTINNAALDQAFARQSGRRAFRDPATGTYWGVGPVRHGKGHFHYRPIGFGSTNNVGMTFGGTGAMSTVLGFDLATDPALTFRVYVHLHVHDIGLHNARRSPGTSAAIELDPTGTRGSGYSGGGGMLQIERVLAQGFGTFIRNFGGKLDGRDTGDGDKTLVQMCSVDGATFYDQTANKQAYGWTFLNNASGSTGATFEMGGAGETLIANHVGNVVGSFIRFPEGSGNPGSGARSYFGQRITVMSTKLEYGGPGARMLVDARASLLLTDQGGSNCDLVFRETSIASGTHWPDPATHVVIKVGNGVAGGDAVRIKQEGGWVEGVVEIGSAQLGALNRRWSFRDAVRAPDPATVRFLGVGSHYLLEWRANENVAVDQYRGGQAFTGSIDAQKAFLWRHVGKTIVHTGVAAAAHAGRRGGQFTIGGFPPKMTVTGLALFVDENRSGTDTLVEWFADAGFSVPIGRASVAGDRRGLQPVVMGDPAKWRTLATGELYVRITKPAAGDDGTEGALVIFYFPYMGA